MFRAQLDDGTTRDPFEIPMEAQALLEAAQQGEFFSYAAGVAYQVLTRYRVGGLKIVNTRTDLPVKKGLSSSAAVCVLVARAFNRVYDLALSLREEMELAYLGEISTPSRCGRLDQGCAYGNRPILMEFDGDDIDVQELSVPSELHFLIVDLHASKDTREILGCLNQSYPFPENDVHRDVQEYLGPINERIVREAVEALAEGDAERIGHLMTKAQSAFDRHMQPACRSELTAPVLHKVLAYEPLQPLVYGGKGVGSQGDGTAQFIARDAESRRRAIEIIEDELGMSCLELTLRPARSVRKAVIPAAGFGTRLFPATKAVKKELFPIVDAEGRAKPVILAIVEEALSAGIEEIAILVQPQDKGVFEELFNTPPRIENFHKLSQDNQEYCNHLANIGRRITFLEQETQEGFGHAVYCAREWVGDEPFLLLLGDTLCASDISSSCAEQVLDTYKRVGNTVIGLRSTPADEIHHFGCAAGSWEENSLLTITKLYEKPSREYAEGHLRVDGIPPGEFLAFFGIYVLTPEIFEHLEESIRSNSRQQGEFQLTFCLERLCLTNGCSGAVVRGRRFDIGNPESYVRAIHEFGQT
jgi:UTP-glucose-1-phosphate uridylyltransferase/galactokinase/mevalonate kinase-like predicted kinase